MAITSLDEIDYGTRWKQLYARIKKLDDLLDEQSYATFRDTGQIPASIDEVMQSSGPCGYLQAAFSPDEIREIEFLAGTTDADRQAMWKMFNGAVFHLARMADLGNTITVNHITPADTDAIRQLGTHNMRWSWLATFILSDYRGEDTITLSSVADQLPTILGDDFFGNEDPNKSFAQRYQSPNIRPYRLSSRASNQAFSQQIKSDILDLFSDLDTELLTGRITSNVVLSRARTMTYSELTGRMRGHFRHNALSWNELCDLNLLESDSLIDMAAMYSQISRYISPEGMLNMDTIKRASPTAYCILFDALHDIGVSSATRDDLEFLATKAAKTSFREAAAINGGTHGIDAGHSIPLLDIDYEAAAAAAPPGDQASSHAARVQKEGRGSSGRGGGM